ncbi:MAG: hypothetical protein ABIN52_07740 [Chitinophagaceae bacterium]
MSFLAVVFLLSGSLCKAQFSKGDRMVGASVASIFYNSGSADITVASIGSNKSVNTSYGINIMPSLGWFISGKTVVGATLNINPNGQKVTYEQNGTTYQSDKSNGFNIGIGGFVRNYFSDKSSLLPFGQISLNGGYSSQKTEGFFYGGSSPAYKITYTGDSNGGSFMNAAFSAGVTKMMGENAGLDFYIGYNFSYNKNVFKKTTLRDNGNDGSIDERGENETTTKFTNHGFSLGIGFQIFLRGKKK